MRRTAAVIIALSALTALLVWWLSSPIAAPALEVTEVTTRPSQPSLSNEARVEGRVVCTHDRPDLEGTVVQFELHGQTSQVTAGRDGRFVFRTSQDGTWSVSVIASPGHLVRASTREFLLGPGAVIDGVELAVDRLPTVSGKVIDPAGQPLAGATVRSRWDRREIVSDVLGEFSLPMEIPGWLFVTQPGYVPARVLVEEDASAPLVITLQPKPPLAMVWFKGMVVDAADRAVAGALIEGKTHFLRGRAPAGSIDEAFSVTSDEAGHFEVQVPAGARITVQATLEKAASLRVIVDGAVVTRLKLFPRESAMSGRVVDPQGRPVTSFRVRVRVEGVDQTQSFSSVEGAWKLERLPTGIATVEVNAAGFPMASREGIELGTAERTGVDFTLERALSLSGVVLDEKTGKPLENAIVRARQNRRTAASDEQGAFLLEALPAGRLELLVEHRGYRGREVIVELPASQPARITLEPEATDGGRVLDYEGVGMQFESSSRPDAGQGYRVSRLHPQGGAQAAGIELGDEILAVGAVNVGSASLLSFMREIKGPEGTVVTLTIRRGGRTFDVHAVRRRLNWGP